MDTDITKHNDFQDKKELIENNTELNNNDDIIDYDVNNEANYGKHRDQNICDLEDNKSDYDNNNDKVDNSSDQVDDTCDQVDSACDQVNNKSENYNNNDKVDNTCNQDNNNSENINNMIDSNKSYHIDNSYNQESGDNRITFGDVDSFDHLLENNLKATSVNDDEKELMKESLCKEKAKDDIIREEITVKGHYMYLSYRNTI